ncbi:helix-turn-helix domain-containing protein [Kamptonema formosum]|jgi:transcriptional regulator with XRE-family HTH domain|uniref:helix-turn-helix domain-containing protein n=1 Tax=Kamptonema formosum TaxID=331992 RepID=UPI000349DCED|nr:helix-turn-helix transcriptional regulator [Oscillatoria sp. PCC 10802]MBW4495267.1 helix-turn-helix transcriptional regulator [Oscillatoria princeps RMCB-10]
MYQVKVRIKELCEVRNWSISELSRRSGVTYSTVWRYATQPMNKMEMDPIGRIKETFGCSWDELLDLQGDSSFDK